MELAPIVIFAYNRPTLLKLTVDALNKNFLANQSDLIIYADGSKDTNDLSLVLEVRAYLKTISGFKSVTVHERERNFGLSTSVIDGVTEIINKYGKIIVLEDDLVTSPYYLKFINDALNMYSDDEQVISVQGYVYPSKIELPQSFFIRGADCQGWATWKRGWDLFETDSNLLLNELKQKQLIIDFNFNNNYPYFKMLEDQALGLKNSWAIRWYASAYLNNKFTLYPGKSLIYNTGFGNNGTNTNNEYLSNNFNSKISLEPIELEKIPIVNSIIGKEAFISFFKRLRLWKNPKALIRHIFNKLTKK